MKNEFKVGDHIRCNKYDSYFNYCYINEAVVLEILPDDTWDLKIRIINPDVVALGRHVVDINSDYFESIKE